MVWLPVVQQIAAADELHLAASLRFIARWRVRRFRLRFSPIHFVDFSMQQRRLILSLFAAAVSFRYSQRVPEQLIFFRSRADRAAVTKVVGPKTRDSREASISPFTEADTGS